MKFIIPLFLLVSMSRTLGGVMLADSLNIRSGVVTNNGVVWHATNDVPSLALPNGSVASVTDGRIFLRASGAWHLLFNGSAVNGDGSALINLHSAGSAASNSIAQVVNALAMDATNFPSLFLGSLPVVDGTNYLLSFAHGTNNNNIIVPLSGACHLVPTNLPATLAGEFSALFVAGAAARAITMTTNHPLCFYTNGWVRSGPFWTNVIPAGKTLVWSGKSLTNDNSYLLWTGVVQP